MKKVVDQSLIHVSLSVFVRNLFDNQTIVVMFRLVNISSLVQTQKSQ